MSRLISRIRTDFVPILKYSYIYFRTFCFRTKVYYYYSWVFRTHLRTFWRTILTSIITWYNYIFTKIWNRTYYRTARRSFLDNRLIFGELSHFWLKIHFSSSKIYFLKKKINVIFYQNFKSNFRKFLSHKTQKDHFFC